MPVEVKVYGDTAEEALADLRKILKVLRDTDIAEEEITASAVVSGRPVSNAKDPLDGTTAREEALRLLRNNYENVTLRPHFKGILTKFGVKAFGEVTPDKGVSFLAEVTRVLREYAPKPDEAAE